MAPRRAHVAALDAALVLLADHELAVSTLAARVAASARADPYSVVSAGLGVLAGGLHGGAGRQVVALFEEVGEPARAGRVVGERLRAGARIPGLGHAVYRERDPRADYLLPVFAALPLLPGRWAVVESVLAIVEARLDVLVNVDFALGALVFAAGMRRDASEAVFGVSRTAGWLAHALEEYDEHPLRFRARAAYTGV
jgi:citrate synthase